MIPIVIRVLGVCNEYGGFETGLSLSPVFVTR